MPKKWMEPGLATASDSAFFLPCLCQPQALLVLVLLAELLVLMLELSQPMQSGFDWVRLGLISLFVQGLALLSAALLCSVRSWLARLSAGVAGTLSCALIVAMSLACTAIVDCLEPGGTAPAEGQANRYLRHGMMSLIMSALFLRYFYLQSRWQKQRQAELQARIEALQARIRPHLLFNTLNSIASLTASDPGKAEQAVLDLSDLLRASLGKPGTLVLWKEEVALAKRYLSIEQYRLGKRLQLDWRINTIPDDLPIPQLTLQPLLENALIHGISPRVDGGVVRVEADYKKGEFILCVSNPYDEAAVAQASGGTQQALPNIGARLAALFGPRASLSVDRRDGRHFTCLRYPCARPTQESSAI